MRLLVAVLALALVSSVAWGQDPCRGCNWQNRESWIVGEQQEEAALVNELAVELGLSAALVLVLPAAELGWWANCVAAGHDVAGTVTIQGKIDRLQFLKSDLPYQNNIWTQQVRNNPQEWHRFQQTNQPFIAWQEQLRRQASHTTHPTACKKKQTKPPNTAVENTDCFSLSQQSCEFVRRGEAIPRDLRDQLYKCVQRVQSHAKGPVPLDC